jgi:phosphoribosylformylglycinamidine synthase
VFTSECEPGEALSLPVKHSFGRWYAPEDELDELERNGRLVLRYAPGHNPNGSVRDVAGVTNEQGNVLGLMPHPEHAVDELNGSADASRLFVSLAATLGTLSPAAA